MESKPLIFHSSPTSISTDWQCGMKYWWYKCEGGNGIVPVEEASYFIEGRELHNDLEPFAKGATVGEALDRLPALDSVAPSQGELEKLCRRRGWLVAFGEFIEPHLREGMEEVLVEDEVVIERDPLWVSTRPDRVQRDQKTGRLRYREWKSTASTRQEWAMSWAHAPQLHLGLLALEEELKEPIDYANVLGFYKGFDREGKLLHPYVYAYRSPTGGWDHEYHYGWEKIGVWEYPEGVEGWVRKCGEDVSRKVFLWSSPCFLDRRMVDSLLRRRVERMKEIGIYKELCQSDHQLRSLIFEERFTQCRPAYGSACQYIAACKNATVNADPIKSGLYVPRTSMSETERGDNDDRD